AARVRAVRLVLEGRGRMQRRRDGAGRRIDPEPRVHRQRLDPHAEVSILVGGPDMAPKPPYVRSAPAEPWRSSTMHFSSTLLLGAPTRPPNPLTFGAPRRSRGAPLRCISPPHYYWGPRHGPQTPLRSARPGGAVALLYHAHYGRGRERGSVVHARRAGGRRWGRARRGARGLRARG